MASGPSVPDLADPLAAAVEALARSAGGALAARRRSALDAYLAAPLPDRALHLWRYTDPRRLLPGGSLRIPAPPAPGPEGPEAARIRPGLLGGGPGEPPPDGVEVLDLAAAHAGGPASEGLGALSSEATSKFEALNLALFDRGVLVRIGREARPGRPVSLVHRAGETGTAAFRRTLVLVGEGAEAALVEEFESPEGGSGLLNSVTEVLLAPGARLVHTVVNTLGEGVTASLVQRARLEAGAALTSVSVSLGAGLVKTEASALLAGRGARSEVLGAVFASGRQQADQHIFQDHEAPHTSSNLLVRVALMERSRASYTGRLRIAPDAPHCEARQENRNLLLSERARADSIPELEILTHEVMCAHAAATGPVDPAMLFYLRSRGLSERDAEAAVVLGFLEPVFGRVPGGELAEALRGAAARRLGG